jgi:RNA recognition motif-containing protein
MALFVGRLPADIRPCELEDIFVEYGSVHRCDVKHGYAFVEFDDPRDAEDAIDRANGTRIRGGEIVVEWAKGTKRSSDECFKCGRAGHWARNCPMTARRGGQSRR